MWLTSKGVYCFKKQKESENERLGENVPKGTVSAPSPITSLPACFMSRAGESRAGHNQPTFNLLHKQQQFPRERKGEPTVQSFQEGEALLKKQRRAERTSVIFIFKG